MSASGQHSQHIACLMHFSNRHISDPRYRASQVTKLNPWGNFNVYGIRNTHTLAQTGIPGCIASRLITIQKVNVKSQQVELNVTYA